MATTINSGYANSPKLTADVASRAEVYGGRGLVFDAVSDYLSVSNISFTGEFTISCWFKADDLSSGRPIVGDTGNSHWFKIADTDTVALNVNGSNTEWDSGAVFSTGVWTFVSVVRDSDNKIIIYKDGIGYTSNQPTKSGTFTTNAIGQKGNSQYFDGTISDIKFYSSALTEAEIQSQYLKPESVPSPSTLVAWYPMCEANPDSPQSIVYDHSENKLGSEKITSNTASDWADFTSNGTEPVRTTTANGVSLKSQGDSRASYHTITGCTNGSLYKVVFNSRTDLSDGNVKIYFNASTTYFTPVISTTDTQYTIYGYAGSSNALQISGLDTGTTIFIENFSVKEVLMGNHATTNFFGDELFTDGDFEASGTTSWDDHVDSHEVTLAKDTGTVKSGSKSLKITRVSGEFLLICIRCSVYL